MIKVIYNLRIESYVMNMMVNILKKYVLNITLYLFVLLITGFRFKAVNPGLFLKNKMCPSPFQRKEKKDCRIYGI